MLPEFRYLKKLQIKLALLQNFYLFYLLKMRLCKQIKIFDLKLIRKSAEKEIKEVFSTISKKEILSSFNHSLKIIRLYLTNDSYCSN